MEKKEHKVIHYLDIAFQINDIYKKMNYKNEHYYYNSETQYNIINVIFDKKDFKINEKINLKIQKKLEKKHNIKKINILVIVFGDLSQELVKNNDFSIVYLKYENWQKDILKVIPDINFDSDFNIMDIYSENEDGETNSLTSDTAKKFNSFEYKKQISNLPFFIILFITTIGIPIIINIFWDVYFRRSSDYIGTTNIQFTLIWGAANHDLIISLNQWWRVITYPFITFGYLQILFNAIILVFFVRFMEININKWKIILVLLLYPFIGIIIIMTNYGYALSGPMVLYSLLIGVGFVSSYKKNDFASLMIKRSTYIAIFLFILFSLFSFNLTRSILISFAFTIGAAYGLFINHNYQKNDWLISIPIIIFSALFLLSISFVLLEEFTKIIPPQNDDVMYVIKLYVKWGLSSPDAIAKLNNYYNI